MVKILLLNVGSKNKGNQALISCTKSIITDYLNEVQIVEMGSKKEYNINNNIIPQIAENPSKNIHTWIYIFECVIIKAIRKCGLEINPPKNSRLEIYDRVDLVVNSGGDQLSGERIVGSSLLNLIYPILLDKPVVLFAESLGYYKNQLNKIMGKYVFNHSQLILVREDLSKEYLLHMGIDESKIHVTADPAYLLPAASKSRTEEILLAESIASLDSPLIGINPSGLISIFLDEKEKSEYHLIQSLTRTIDHLVKTKGANILLIPHVYTAGGDDRKFIQKILKNIPNHKNVYQITGEYSANELKGIIGLCDMFIGARMHATIAATSLYIPTVGIAYSHKMHGIIGKTLGLEQYIIDIKDIDDTILIKTCDTVWDNKDEIKKNLERVIPDVKKKASMNGYYLSEYLNSN